MPDNYIEYTAHSINRISALAAEIAEQKTAAMRQMTAEEYRLSQHKLADIRLIPAFIEVEKEDIAGVTCEWIYHNVLELVDLSDNIIIYIHGGSWMFGDLDSARPVAPMLIRETGFRVLVVDYKKAPEHQYPAGFNDVYAVYCQLLERGINNNNIALFGDSAGGNLALALLNKLKTEEKPMPRCVALASPATDLRDEGALFSSDSDLIYTVYNNKEHNIFEVYLGESNYKNRDLPTVSPITAELSGLPPVLIHAGSEEAIAQDNIAYAEKMHKQGGDITLKIWKGMFHDFTIVGYSLKESRESLGEIGKFFRKHMPNIVFGGRNEQL